MAPRLRNLSEFPSESLGGEKREGRFETFCCTKLFTTGTELDSCLITGASSLTRDGCDKISTADNCPAAGSLNDLTGLSISKIDLAVADKDVDGGVLCRDGSCGRDEAETTLLDECSCLMLDDVLCW